MPQKQPMQETKPSSHVTQSTTRMSTASTFVRHPIFHISLSFIIFKGNPFSLNSKTSVNSAQHKLICQEIKLFKVLGTCINF